MARPSKPLILLESEGKSHRTKAEKAHRAAAEKAMLTGYPLHESPEVKTDLVAHREFLRQKRLMRSIGKDDDIFAESVNRYCLYHSECKTLVESRKLVMEKITEMQSIERYLGPDDMAVLQSLYAMYTEIDKNLEKKRDAMLRLEKENAMTIAAALRSVPKKQEEQVNPLQAILNG